MDFGIRRWNRSLYTYILRPLNHRPGIAVLPVTVHPLQGELTVVQKLEFKKPCVRFCHCAALLSIIKTYCIQEKKKNTTLFSSYGYLLVTANFTEKIALCACFGSTYTKIEKIVL